MTDYQFNRFITALKGIEKQIKELRKEISERNANSATIVLGEIKPPKQPIDPMGYTE